MQPDVLVIGGGVSGLAAAVDLSSHGFSVLLVEQKHYCGGRTYSIIHEPSGDEVDNGQHLMMGCYRATIRFLGAIGSLSDVAIQPRLSVKFRHAANGGAELRAAALPAPFHIAFGLLGLSSLSLADRISLLRVGTSLFSLQPDVDSRLQSMSVAEWLTTLSQSDENRKYLWDILAIGTLNDVPHRVSAALFIKVLQSAFFGSRKNSSMMIPRKGLSSVFVERSLDFLKQHHAQVRTGLGVERVHVNGGKVEGVALSNGERLSPREVISAVPYFDIPRIFDSAVINRVPEFACAERFTSSPIVTMHLWFDSEFVKEDFVALLDSPIHWIFNKRRILGSSGSASSYLSLVISGAEDFLEMEKEKMISLALSELQRFYPSSRQTVLLHSLVIKEKRATFSPRVGMECFRPSHTTSVDNLFLAGDWTDTKLPATIEGAIQSGYACSELARKHL